MTPLPLLIQEKKLTLKILYLLVYMNDLLMMITDIVSKSDD